MSDEIDIEEHDVMDDPTIKRIFPDLSVIKKEINQYNYDEDLNSPTGTALLEDLGQGDTMAKDLEDHLPKDIQNSNEMVTPSTFHVSEALETKKESKCLNENIIILGTKPYLECQENDHNCFKKEPRLMLKNINSFLNTCKRYCNKCLILFPKANIFNLHMINVHTKRKNHEMAFMGRQVGYKLFKCSACDKFLASRCNLFKHFRILHGDIKALQTVDTSKEKIVANEATQSKATTGPSCFHCQQLFPTQSSLIEHLYEVLDPNKIGSSNRAMNSTNTTDPNKEVNCNYRFIDDNNVKNLDKSNVSYKNNLEVTRRRSFDKVDTDNSDSSYNTAECGDENIKTKKRKGISEPLLNGDTNLRKRMKTDKCNERKEKFHSKKELKYHINSIHIQNSNKTKEVKLKPMEETHHLNFPKKPLHKKFYQCFICSRYNVTFEYYSRHLIKNHNIQKVTEVRKVPFDSNCKFCPSKFSGINSYNVHVFKYHSEILKETYFPRKEKTVNKKYEKVNKHKQFALKNILYKCMKCDLYLLSSNAAMDHSKHLEISDTWKCSACQRLFTRDDMVLHEKQHSFSVTFTVHTLSELEFSKILYKCSNCTVHYSEENFWYHYPKCDSETPNSLYCKVCDIIINKDDMERHVMNHKEKNIACCEFIIIEPDIIDLEHQSPITNKMENGKSNVIDDRHVMPNTNKMKIDTSNMIDESYVSPYTATKKKDKADVIDESLVSPNTAAKKNDKADIIDEIYLSPKTAIKKKDKSDITDDRNIGLKTTIKKKDKSDITDHRNIGLNTTIKKKDPSVITDDRNIGLNTTIKKKEKSDITDHRNIGLNTTIKKKDPSDITDDRNIGLNTTIKKKDKSDITDDRNIGLNTTIKKKDKSDITDDQNIGFNTTIKKKDPSDMIDRSPNRTKTKNNIVKRFLKSRLGNDGLVEYSKLAMSFCHTCKCFIGNMNLRKLHIEGKCGHMLKLVCKGCGLLLTTKTHETHKEYHKKEQLSLQDYSFYDLRTEKRICPPVPEYPKCNSCGVHFLRNCDVKTHSCQEQEYITCNVCFMKLIDEAYKLHIHFHSYSMSSVNKKVKDTALQANIANKISYVEPNSIVSDDPHITDVYYTCKSCQLTVNTYDTVVQHCHDHYNSDVIKLLTQKCQKCTLMFQRSDYTSHLNGKCNNDSIKVVDFDPFYFRHNNDFWTKHIFAYVADEDISKILRNSIYRYECRLKMEKIQSGSANSVLYKCDKCQVYIDPQFLYTHAVNSRDQSCVKLRKHPCALCGLSFGSKAYRNAHEKDHESIEINLKSHKIVLYNKDEHESYNKIMYDASNRYILYQCRSCEKVVDKFDRHAHNCDESNLKLCSTCGLLLDKQDFDLHFIRHEELEQFDVENIIVIMFGKPKLCYLGKKKHSSTFSGTKYDYTLYKCKDCDICLRTKKCISEHTCVLENLKCKCSKCGLYFSELDLKDHCEVHQSNLGFDDLSMDIITVDPSSANLAVDSNDKLGESSDLAKQSEEVVVENISVSLEKQEIIYRCDCGLHFLEELNAQQHANNCNPRMKISKQSCIRCDLLFTPGELFNHLLKHHCDKKLQFKFDIVLVSANKKK